MATKITVTGSTYGLPPALRTGATKPLAGQKATRAQVPVGWVRLLPDGRDDLAAFCELGDDVPDLQDGYGGIVTTDRPGDKALTRDGGHPAGTMPMQLVLADPTGANVDDLYDNLEALAGRGRKRMAGPRPKLLVDTAGLFRWDASVFPNGRWWLSDLSWSKDEEDQETDEGGHRIVAVANLTLTEVTEATDLQTRAVKARLAHEAKTSAKKTYKTVSGDTLIKIAHAKLKDSGRWPEIAAINPGFRDPTATIAAGSTIYLP